MPRNFSVIKSFTASTFLVSTGGNLPDGGELEFKWLRRRTGLAMRRLRICGIHPQVQTFPLHRMIAGITGGLGCGKSTAARMLEARGFRRLDSDQIVRDQVLRDAAVLAALGERYGPEIIGRDGAVNRPLL